MDHIEKRPQSKSPFRASEDEVVRMLNGLMTSLHLPIPIESPTDLTPSLLFAILESLLGQKLLIPSGQNHQDQSYSGSGMLKVQKVKLFLGVLETDILQEDVGLSKIDPRRLAAGEWPEAFFVARVLCMVGLQLGLILSTSQNTVPVSSPRVEDKKRRDSSPTRVPPRALIKTWSDPTSGSCTMATAAHRYSPQPQPSQFPTPELDTTCVFYAPSSTNTRDTHTMTTVFDEVDSVANDSFATSPDLDSPPPKATRRGRPRGSSQTIEPPTPSSVTLSLEPPFQSPPPSSRTYSNHNPSASLLFSVDGDISHRHVDSRPSSRRKRHRERAFTSPTSSRPPPMPTSTSGQSTSSSRRHNSQPFNSTASTSSSCSHLDIESDYDFHPLKVPVRHSGYIEPVDEDSEIASYEHSRSFNLSVSSPRSPFDSKSVSTEEDSTGNSSILNGLNDDGEEDTGPFDRSLGRSYSYNDENQTTRTIAAIHEEYERTLKLLDERAKLLQELAEMNIA